MSETQVPDLSQVLQSLKARVENKQRLLKTSETLSTTFVKIKEITARQNTEEHIFAVEVRPLTNHGASISTAQGVKDCLQHIINRQAYLLREIRSINRGIESYTKLITIAAAKREASTE